MQCARTPVKQHGHPGRLGPRVNHHGDSSKSTVAPGQDPQCSFETHLPQCLAGTSAFAETLVTSDTKQDQSVLYLVTMNLDFYLKTSALVHKSTSPRYVPTQISGSTKTCDFCALVHHC